MAVKRYFQFRGVAPLFHCRNKKMRAISAALDTKQMWWESSEPRKNEKIRIVFYFCFYS